jgi:hypothetical protein
MVEKAGAVRGLEADVRLGREAGPFDFHAALRDLPADFLGGRRPRRENVASGSGEH